MAGRLNEAEAMPGIAAFLCSWRRSFPGADNRRPPYLEQSARFGRNSGDFFRGKWRKCLYKRE